MRQHLGGDRRSELPAIQHAFTHFDLTIYPVAGTLR